MLAPKPETLKPETLTLAPQTLNPKPPLKLRAQALKPSSLNLTSECVLLLEKVFSYYRRCSLTIEGVLLLEKVFSYYTENLALKT
jgi:hypothetical protein